MDGRPVSPNPGRGPATKPEGRPLTSRPARRRVRRVTVRAIPDGGRTMRLLARLAVRLAGAWRRRAEAQEPCDGGSSPEPARAALRPGKAIWLVTRAVSLRAF